MPPLAKFNLIPRDMRPVATDHNGNLSAEVLDVFSPLSEMNRILTDVEQGKTVGAVEALREQLKKALVEIEDLDDKLVKSGLAQQVHLFDKEKNNLCPGEKIALPSSNSAELNKNLCQTSTANIQIDSFVTMDIVKVQL